MKKNLALGVGLLSMVAAACGNPQIESTGTIPTKQEHKLANTRELHFELQGNTLLGPHYKYINMIQEEVRATMTQEGRATCDVTVIETLDPRSLNSNGELELQADTFPRIDVEIAGYVTPEEK